MDAVIALGSNAHLFAQPSRRQELARCFETVLGCGPAAVVEHPAMSAPMLLITFPGGGHLSIEFTSSAPDDDAPRLGAWLELRADDPAATMRAVLDAGLVQVQHPGHPYYFMARAARCSPSCPPGGTRPSEPAPQILATARDGCGPWEQRGQ